MQFRLRRIVNPLLIDMKWLRAIALASVLLCGAKALAQSPQREIRETVTADFVPGKDAARESPLLMGSSRIGVQTLHKGAYRDSLMRWFERFEEYVPEEKDTAAFRYFRGIYGADTLCFHERRPVIVADYAGRRRLEVESLLAPYQRFEVGIDGLGEEEILALVDSLQRMRTSDRLLNNSQTCIFYALNLLLDRAGINPAPVITRNTTFTDGTQLNAFFDHLLKLKGSYPCKYKELRKAELPGDCVLVFRNARAQYIHAVFYRKDTGEFYTKNGLFTPVIVKDIRPICERYGCYDAEGLDAAAQEQRADTVLVFTL